MQLTKYKFELSNPIERLLKDDQVESVKEDLKFARRFLNALTYRVQKELDDTIKDNESTVHYENPNWTYLQAEQLGYRRALRKVLEFIDPKEVNDD